MDDTVRESIKIEIKDIAAKADSYAQKENSIDKVMQYIDQLFEDSETLHGRFGHYYKKVLRQSVEYVHGLRVGLGE